MTGPIVITLGMVDATGHDNRSVPICIVVVRVSKMTDVVMNTDRCRHRGDHDLVVDMNIDIEIETYRGAGLAASRLTQGGHIALTSAVILLAADLAVPVIVATGTTNEIDAIGLTEIEIQCGDQPQNATAVTFHFAPRFRPSVSLAPRAHLTCHGYCQVTAT